MAGIERRAMGTEGKKGKLRGRAMDLQLVISRVLGGLLTGTQLSRRW
jgi:hypothetical protein